MALTLALVGVIVCGAAPLKVAATNWQYTGIGKAEGEVFEDRFVTLLGERTGVTVLTQRDLAAVLGLERQKQMLGCEPDGNECMAELSSALGADAMLTGTLAKTEKSFVVTLRGVNTATGKTFATASARLPTDEALFAWLEGEAGHFADRMRESFEAWVEAKRAVHYQYKTWPWLASGGGLVVLATGATLFGLSRLDLASIRSTPPTPGDPLIVAGQVKQDLGVGLGIAGVAVAAAGVGLLFFTREAKSSVVLAPSPGGGFLAVGGRW